MANFLLEIGLEEIPAHLVTPAIEQLERRIADFMVDERLAYGTIKAYSTPRRLAVLVADVADKAEDFEEEVKGPAKKAALDAEGNFSKAAQGFVRGQGLTTDDITFKEFNGNEYVYVTKFEAGKPALDVLAEVKQVVEAMTFATTMKWGRHTFEYVRPIRWLVALLDDEIVPFEILGVATGRTTRGHRFLGHDIEIDQATSYEAQLKTVYVEADAAERKGNILQQVEQIATEHNWKVVVDEDLLEEVNNILEYPTAFAGSFDEEYLQVPDEVLITSMKEHQRFFHIVDSEGMLLPHFISVRNGNAEHLENVIAGNEKVLVARLEDAKFFYSEDQKHPIDFYNDKLQVVSFHAKLGSVASHTHRAKVIATLLAEQIKLDVEQVTELQRAADIYKFDLMTGMVGEFDELQGIMGEKYARLFGESASVAQAIREHYMPISADGELPASELGKVLAVADKLDSLLSFFTAGMVPSGSNDPYALRRAASGVVAILADNGWNFDLVQILGQAAEQINAATDKFGLPIEVATALQENVENVITFLTDRVAKTLQDQGIRRDIINAVTNNAMTDTTLMLDAADALNKHHEDSNFRDGVEALTRVMRLMTKNPTAETVQPALFENDVEANLYQAVQPLSSISGLNDRMIALLALQPVIAAYFEDTMVMVEDEAVKNNRLATLQLVANEATKLANFLELDVKSK